MRRSEGRALAREEAYVEPARSKRALAPALHTAEEADVLFVSDLSCEHFDATSLVTGSVVQVAGCTASNGCTAAATADGCTAAAEQVLRRGFER